jgi:hypothetical protein
MNQRIRELAEQVGAVQNVLAMGRHDGVLFTETELERFVGLIVRECALQCQHNGDMDRIEKHFGVEE